MNEGKEYTNKSSVFTRHIFNRSITYIEVSNIENFKTTTSIFIMLLL